MGDRIAKICGSRSTDVCLKSKRQAYEQKLDKLYQYKLQKVGAAGTAFSSIMQSMKNRKTSIELREEIDRIEARLDALEKDAESTDFWDIALVIFMVIPGTTLISIAGMAVRSGMTPLLMRVFSQGIKNKTAGSFSKIKENVDSFFRKKLIKDRKQLDSIYNTALGKIDEAGNELVEQIDAATGVGLWGATSKVFDFISDDTSNKARKSNSHDTLTEEQLFSDKIDIIVAKAEGIVSTRLDHELEIWDKQKEAAAELAIEYENIDAEGVIEFFHDSSREIDDFIAHDNGSKEKEKNEKEKKSCASNSYMYQSTLITLVALCVAKGDIFKDHQATESHQNLLDYRELLQADKSNPYDRENSWSHEITQAQDNTAPKGVAGHPGQSVYQKGNVRLIDHKRDGLASQKLEIENLTRGGVVEVLIRGLILRTSTLVTFLKHENVRETLLMYYDS